MILGVAMMTRRSATEWSDCVQHPVIGGAAEKSRWLYSDTGPFWLSRRDSRRRGAGRAPHVARRSGSEHLQGLVFVVSDQFTLSGLLLLLLTN